MTEPSLINVHSVEYSQELHYYPFAVNLERRVGSYNTFNDLSKKLLFPRKTWRFKYTWFNMIIGINESKTLTKFVSSKCKCEFDCRKCYSNQKWNNGKFWCEYKKHHVCEKIIFGILLNEVMKIVII